GTRHGGGVAITAGWAPGAAASAAAAGLLARPYDGAFGGAAVRQPRRFVVGAADALQRHQRPPVRQDGCGAHGKRPFAAAAAARLSGCGASAKIATVSAEAKATARLTANPGWSSASAGSSKYITLTMRT